MTWAANAATHNAFKVLSHSKAGNVRLCNAYGVTSTYPVEDLEASGYRLVKTKPSYADLGCYRPCQKNRRPKRDRSSHASRT